MKTYEFLQRPFAHRGLHGNGVPENSMSAFRAAVAGGFAIETDVRFTKEGRIVVYHDDNLYRMTGDIRDVIECTAPELKHLRLEDTDEQMPLFSELLKEINGRVPLLIEIKSMRGVKPKEIALALDKLLEGYQGEYAIQSFQPFYVRAFKRLRPDVPCGVLSAAHFTREDIGGAFWKLKAHWLSHMTFNYTVKPDFISYNLHDLPTRKTKRFKGPVLAWTVRSEEDELLARKHAQTVIFEHYIPRHG